MTDQFAFLGDKCKAAIAAMSLGVLLLLPASLGYGGTIIQEAFGQFNLPLLEDQEPEAPEEEDGGIVVEEEPEEETPEEETTPTTPTTPAAPTGTTGSVEDPSTYLLADRNVEAVRGFIGSTLPAQGAGGGGAITPAADDSGHIVTGRFRVFANETLVRRFVAEMNVAAIDGSSFNNITITEGAPHRFEVTQANGTTGAQGASSNIVGSIYLNGGTTPVIDNVPMTLTIRGQSLAIQGIDIDETRITDTGLRDTISVIDGQSIYGTIPRV
jgi:cytoskeletal protein RodZ